MIIRSGSKKQLIYLIIFIFLVVGVTSTLSVYTSYKVRGFFIDNSKKLLENTIFLLKESVDQFYKQTLDNVSANFNLFHSEIYNKGSFSMDRSKTIKQAATNQITNIKKEVDLNIMMYDGKPVLNNFKLVDSIVDRVRVEGVATTIFQVIDNGILRITTNVKKLNGDRAVGTFIPSDSIVYRTVMSGNKYSGRAYVVNQWYWTVYEPIFSDGEIIGVLYMGIQESVLLNALRRTFDSVTIGLSGYPFLMDADGHLIIHPFSENSSLKDVATSDGKVLYDIMISQRSGWVEYKYPKPNDIATEYVKLTRFMTVDSLGWVVGAGVYEDEFYTDFAHYEIFYIIVLMIVITVTGSIVAFNIFKTNRKLVNQSIKLQQLALDAENANIAKSAFLANMSHEIRTPLNSILGFSDLLKASELNPKEKEFAETISQGASTLLSIINDILDISKIESGKLDLIDEEFDLQHVLDNIIKMISVRAKQKDIKFFYFYDTDIPSEIIGDSVRLQQVLMNLLSNAVKFTDANGEINLTVHLLYKGTEHETLKFNVSDTGIGIPQDAIDQIFDPFNQADAGISRKYGGTGLGLTICSKLVEMMGSKVKVASVAGKGTTFSFTLPLKKVDYEFDHVVEKPFKDRHFCIAGNMSAYDNIKRMVVSYLRSFGDVDFVKNTDGRCDMVFCFSSEEVKDHYTNIDEKLTGVPVAYVGDDSHLTPDTMSKVDYLIDHPIYLSKVYNAIIQACGINEIGGHELSADTVFRGDVLVAEDNHTNQLLIKILLEKYKLKADFVDNGQQTLDYCRTKRPDLILMDINMPVMDGVTAYFEIKKFCASEKVPMIPVVALTANAVKGDREKYLETGMNDYLSKPIDNAELLRVLSAYLKKESGEDKVRQPAEKVAEQYSEKYDKQKSLAKVGIKEQDYDMIIDQLFKSLDDDLRRLEKAILDEDINSIYSIIHYLKGAASNLQLTPVAKLLEKYNDKAKTGVVKGYDTEKIRALFEEIRKQI